jgi:hypothetical protein
MGRTPGWLLVFGLAACQGPVAERSASDWTAAPVVIAPPYHEVIAVAHNRLGAFDPSLTFDSGERRLRMSYSSVDREPGSGMQVVYNRSAFSTDGGKSWQNDLYPLNAPVVRDLLFLGRGSWWTETTSLLYDPVGPVTERYKLLSLRYLALATGERYVANQSWIEYKAAPSFWMLPFVTPTKLLSGHLYNSLNDVVNPITQPPLLGAPVITEPALHHPAIGLPMPCGAFSEPDIHRTAAGLFVVLLCIEVPPGASAPSGHPIVLFEVSTEAGCTITQAACWRYRGTLLSDADAEARGFDGYSAADLVTGKNGSTYLLASPFRHATVFGVPVEDAYQGCHVFRIEHLSTATVARQSGLPTLVKNFESDTDFAGACAYDAAAVVSGVLFGRVTAPGDMLFEIFGTGFHLE